jgi:hypothetical protein
MISKERVVKRKGDHPNERIRDLLTKIRIAVRNRRVNPRSLLYHATGERRHKNYFATLRRALSLQTLTNVLMIKFDSDGLLHRPNDLCFNM